MTPSLVPPKTEFNGDVMIRKTAWMIPSLDLTRFKGRELSKVAAAGEYTGTL